MSDLPTSTLGRTGLTVTKLGYGAMELRGPGARRSGPNIDDATAGALLNQVIDSGINWVDTSPDYGVSEELIGRHLSSRRADFFLASKCGCAVSMDGSPVAFGEHDFARSNVRAGVEQSLRRMQTDHLDLVQFHASPTRERLEEDDSVAELLALQDEGKVRFIGMSGTLPNIEGQIEMGVFDAFQIPYSAVEREHEEIISRAAAAGAGTVIRGGVARGVPVAGEEAIERLPENFRDVYRARRERFNGADLTDMLDDMSPMEFMLRFTISHPDMDTTIVGTANPDHLAANLAAAAKGPLPADLYQEAKQRLASAPQE
ncbi:MAG TPA: aldo/keto reductase [Acidimicrobiales bacterium]|nr:aldo/keto reductase [Acidimicrobiales bacterium]